MRPAHEGLGPPNNIQFPDYIPFPDRREPRRVRTRRLLPTRSPVKIAHNVARAFVKEGMRGTEKKLDIGYRVYGNGPHTVIFNHGTPGSSEDERAKYPPEGVRVLAYDRGGYGPSTPFDRIVADQATILEALLEVEEIEGPVSVFGISGGVPGALAQWALVPQVVNAVLVSGLAPSDANTGPVGAESWMKSNVSAYGAKSIPELDALWRRFEADAGRMQIDSDVIMRQIWPELSKRDRKLLTENEELRSQVTATQVAGSISGPAGRFEDVVSTGMDWGLGVDPRYVIKPIFPFFGEYDLVTPNEHSSWYQAAFGSWRTGRVYGGSFTGHFRPIASISRLYERLLISAEHLAKVKVQEVPVSPEGDQVASHIIQFQDPYKEEYMVDTVRGAHDRQGRACFETTITCKETTRNIVYDPAPLDLGKIVTVNELLKTHSYYITNAEEVHRRAIDVARCYLANGAEFQALWNAGFFGSRPI